MSEQATATSQVKASAENLTLQSSQAAKAMEEQAKAMKTLTAGSRNVTTQIKLISHANVEHATSAASILQSLAHLRDVSKSASTSARQASGSATESASPAPKRKTASRRTPVAESGGDA